MNFSFLLLLISFLFTIYLLVIVSIFFSPSSIKSIIEGAPPVPSRKEDISFALRAVELSRGDVLYDLGSGTGRVVEIAQKEFNAQSVGIERSLFFFIFSKIIFFFKGVNAKIIRDDFLSISLSDADILYIYGSKKIMTKLESRLKRENSLKIVSYCFSFPNISPSKKITSPKGNNIFIYKI